MWRRIREIMQKEVRQTLREPRMRILLFGPPVIQLLLFGYAVNMDVEDARLAWVDRDQSPESRELLFEFNASRYLEVVHMPRHSEEARDLLDRGEVHAVISLLPGFAEDIRRGRKAHVQVLVDGTDSNTASIVSNYAGAIVARYNERLVRERKAVRRSAPELTVISRVWFNPNLRSQNYFVPGVVVNIIAIVTIMLTAMAIVREKEIGTMEQLMVTPIRPIELMLGKTLPFAVVGLLEVILVVTLALLVFAIPFRGNPLLLLLCAGIFLLTTLGAGLLISTLSNTQQQAMMGSFFVFMPAFLLSGFAFPIRNMPLSVQYLTYLNPVRYFMEIVRGIFLKGTGMAVLWPQMLALLILGAGLIVVSSLRFHKRLD